MVCVAHRARLGGPQDGKGATRVDTICLRFLVIEHMEGALPVLMDSNVAIITEAPWAYG